MPQTSPTASIWRGHWRGGTVEITLAEDGSVGMEGEVAVSLAGVPP